MIRIKNTESGNNGKIRKKKTKFTQTQNTLARDRNLSLKAKGLYLLINSYITWEDFDLTKGSIFEKCKEGRKAFDNSWNELKVNGYLKVYMQPSSHGWNVEYALMDEREEGAHTYYLNRNGEITSTNLTKLEEKNSGLADNENCQKRTNAKGGDAKGVNGNRTNAQGIYAIGGNNNNTSYNTLNNTYDNNQSSIKNDMNDKDYQILRDNVIKQIDYFVLKEQYPYTNVVDDVLEIIIDVLSNDGMTIRVNREEKSSEVVKSVFRKIDYSHIEYVLSCFDKQIVKASNIRSYLITTLYNAPMTINAYYTNLVNHDMANY